MRHQAEILSEVITILSIKSSLKKSQHSKWKTCLVKTIIAAKFIHYLLMKSSVFPHFYKKIWVPPLLWFLESINPLLNKGVGGCSHYTWCANDITIYSKKNFLSFSINKKNPISQFCNLLLLEFGNSCFYFFTDLFVSLPL